jgi:hypothetical protein
MGRFLGLLLLLTGTLLAANFKLYLKDGSFHVPWN